MTAISDKLFFELGGPAYRLMQRVGIIKGAGPSVARRSVVFIAITWLPLLVFTTLEGHAIGPTPRSAFLLDFATYARFLLVVPLIFAAEKVTGPRMRTAGLRFIHAGLIRPESHADFAMARKMNSGRYASRRRWTRATAVVRLHQRE